MHRFSHNSADLTDEYGIRLGRWTQYSATEGLPFDAMWCIIPPGSQSEEDCHAEVELAVVLTGAGTFESAGTKVDAPLGTAVLFDSNERHVVHNRSLDSSLVLLSVYWLPSDGR